MADCGQAFTTLMPCSIEVGDIDVEMRGPQFPIGRYLLALDIMLIVVTKAVGGIVAAVVVVTEQHNSLGLLVYANLQSAEARRAAAVNFAWIIREIFARKPLEKRHVL